MKFMLRSLFLVILATLPTHSALADDDGIVKLACPAHASNLKLYQTVLKSQIKSSIDTSKYLAPKIRVTMKLVRADPATYTDAFSSITDGLTLTQSELSFSTSGSLGYVFSCDYTYRVTIQVTATDATTGARLRTTNESMVTLSSAGEGVVRDIIPPPTPTPTATPTPSS